MAGYPSSFDLDLALRGGGAARFRPLQDDDADRLVRFFQRLEPHSDHVQVLAQRTVAGAGGASGALDYDDRMAFVALVDNEIVGVGHYERVAGEPQVARVVVAVDQDHRRRGVATQLLQLLTVYGHQHGVARFRSHVFPERKRAVNTRMWRVLRKSGYMVQRHENGLGRGVAVDLPIPSGEDLRAAGAEGEKRAISASLLPIFYPTSVAVIGASRRRDSIPGRLFANLLAHEFNGPVYPVNPRAEVVHSVHAYPSVLDIPGPVDLAFVVVPADQVLPVVQECGQKGVRGLVVISAGFSEVGEEGKEKEVRLLEAVRAGGMRMVGPNCMGLINTDETVELDGTFAPGYPPRGNVAMSSQSGALGVAILEYAQQHGIGISTFISVGNKADVSGNDLMLYWEDDPATDVILLYLESFGNPRRFGRVARRIARKKPIVAVKSGRTTAGERAASSHTGALASLDVAVDALFQQTGVIRTNTLEELFDVTLLLANQPVPRGNRVAVLTNAGGPGILAADALESSGLQLPEFSPELQAQLRRCMAAQASPRNPVDLIASGGPKEYAETLAALLRSDEVDSVIVIYIPPDPTRTPEVARAVAEAARSVDGEKTLLTVFMSAAEVRSELDGPPRRIPVYEFPEAAALALSRAARYGEWRREREGRIPELPALDTIRARVVVEDALTRLGPEGGWLSPGEVSDILGAFGLQVARTTMARSPEEAVRAAAAVGGPVAVKVVSPSVLHKSDLGGVVLGIEGEAEVRRAYEQVTGVVEQADGVVIQEMVPAGHEVLIGITEDPSFGPLIVFGLGGVFVELLGDVSFRICPITDHDASSMVREFKAARILEGYRGAPPGDTAAVEEALLRVSALVEAVPELKEMDLNPVKVLPPGEGIRVLDARMRVVPVAEGWAPVPTEVPVLPRP